MLNKALLTIGSKRQGPIHINLAANISCKFDVDKLPKVNKINRFFKYDILPELPNGKIGIFIGSHNRFENDETNLIESFCKKIMLLSLRIIQVIILANISLNIH